MTTFLRRLIGCAAPTLFFFAAFGAARAEDVVQTISIPTVANPPPVDGTLTSPIWQQGAKVTLGYDRLSRGPSAEPTTAYLLTDGKAIYVGFDATQTRSPILTNQHNNNSGADTDDEVKIALWPSGAHGVNYQFVSTPIGTRYQVSTENLSYEPTWDAAGHVGHNEYSVTMRIPLSIMRGANQKTWLVNLTRWEPETGALYAWSGGPAFNGTNDTNFARPLLGMPTTVASRPKPRIGVYGLGEIAPPYVGGNTSRSGADLAIPITDSASFIATIHPDFSNVERDQQTIAPSALRRFFTETRPFFTQGANYYNYFECDACPNEQSLYTPSIPTPRDGYAIEGKQGPLTFAGFDAVGAGRNDTAQSAIYTTLPRTLYVSAQRVAVDMPGFKDDTQQYAAKWDDLQHKFVYLDYGSENGTNVTAPSKATFAEVGAGFYGPHSFTGGGIRRIGAQYNPFDGFVSNNDIAGYGLFSQHTWTPVGSKFRSLTGALFLDSYRASSGQLGQYDINLQLDVVTRNLWEFISNTGSSYLLVSGAVVPVTQESQRLIYHTGTSTPTEIQFFTGRYGGGRLNSWFRTTTFKAGQRGLISLEADDTRQYLDKPLANGSTVNIQWLERASYTYQFDANTSLALGVRRFFGPPPTPNGGSICTIPQHGDPNALGFCPNVSVAYYRRLQHDELYVIYGNPSQTVTVPQFLVKFIHYFGAEKGA